MMLSDIPSDTQISTSIITLQYPDFYKHHQKNQIFGKIDCSEWLNSTGYVYRQYKAILLPKEFFSCGP